MKVSKEELRQARRRLETFAALKGITMSPEAKAFWLGQKRLSLWQRFCIRIRARRAASTEQPHA